MQFREAPLDLTLRELSDIVLAVKFRCCLSYVRSTESRRTSESSRRAVSAIDRRCFFDCIEPVCTTLNRRQVRHRTMSDPSELAFSAFPS